MYDWRGHTITAATVPNIHDGDGGPGIFRMVLLRWRTIDKDTNAAKAAEAIP
jgi:hypothetical protein